MERRGVRHGAAAFFLVQHVLYGIHVQYMQKMWRRRFPAPGGPAGRIVTPCAAEPRGEP